MNILEEELIKQVEKGLNNDHTVFENTRMYSFTLTLVCDNITRHFEVNNGHFELIDEITSSDLTNVLIQGSNENWIRVVHEIPGGLHQAFRHKLLDFKGDLTLMLSIWKTIWRLGEVLSFVSKEEKNVL